MSDSWIFWKPRMDEPSNPIPSAQMPASGWESLTSSEAGMEKCCQRPGRSLNFKSTILISFFFIRELIELICSFVTLVIVVLLLF